MVVGCTTLLDAWDLYRDTRERTTLGPAGRAAAWAAALVPVLIIAAASFPRARFHRFSLRAASGFGPRRVDAGATFVARAARDGSIRAQAGQFGYSDGFPYCLVAETNKTKWVISRSYLQLLYVPTFLIILIGGVLLVKAATPPCSGPAKDAPDFGRRASHVAAVLAAFVFLGVSRLYLNKNGLRYEDGMKEWYPLRRPATLSFDESRRRRDRDRPRPGSSAASAATRRSECLVNGHLFSHVGVAAPGCGAVPATRPPWKLTALCHASLYWWGLLLFCVHGKHFLRLATDRTASRVAPEMAGQQDSACPEYRARVQAIRRSVANSDDS